ncbi:MAG TPA: SusC/RagA family TonB-linked outer membrane protein [Edaphocola sp.]|nr:SusC/RagA family TonB-linked outer membrane protein [Edaphocola sp.]
MKRLVLLLALCWTGSHFNISWAQDTAQAPPPASAIPDNMMATPVPGVNANTLKKDPVLVQQDSSSKVMAPDSNPVPKTAAAKEIRNNAALDSLTVDTTAKVVAETVSGAAQEYLRGVVMAPQGKEPIPGVAVHWIGHKKATQTDADGKFTLPFYAGDSILVSSAGFSPQVIRVKAGTNDLKITLAMTSENVVKEVVITAMGIMRDKARLSYDVQTIGGADINEVHDGSGNIMSDLRGKVAGLQIDNTSGGAGSAVKILLRGNRSISRSNSPLVVVDGIPYSASAYGTQSSDENGGYTGADGAMNINAADVLSISILKGGAAAALYGGGGSNGALIITTKSGLAGKLRINYNGGFSYQFPYLLMGFQNTYGRGNSGLHSENSGFSWGAPGTTYAYNVRDFFQPALTLNNSVSFSGGSENLQGYASYTNATVQGILPGNLLQRHTLNTRVTGNIANKLSADVKVTYMDQMIKNIPRVGEVGTPINAYIMPRDVSREDLNHYEDLDDYGQPVPAPWPTTNTSIYMNPEWFIHNTSVNAHRERATIMGSLKYDFTNWLNIQARYGMDMISDRTTQKFYDKTAVLSPNPGGQYTETNGQNVNHYADLIISGKNKFLKNFSVDYNLGASFTATTAYSESISANGLTIANKFYMKYASAPSVSNSYNVGGISYESVFATAQVGFRDYLFLDGTFRNDWQAYLPSPYSFAYPSFGLNLIISDALKLPDWVNFGKVRAAYAVVGIGGNPYITNPYFSFAPGGGHGFISRDATMAIPDLKPELSPGFEVGTDWSFFKDRLMASVSLYRTNTLNQLFNAQMAPTTGYSSRWINAGNVQNEGIEIMLSGTPYKKNNFSWTSTLNFSRNINKIIELSDELNEFNLNSSDRVGRLKLTKGGSFGDIYGGVWAKDAQGRHLIDANGLPVVESDEKIGNASPDWLMGWQNEFHYKDFSLSFLISGSMGGIFISGTDGYMAYYGVADYTTAFRNGGLVLPGVYEDGSPNTTRIDAEKFWTTVSNGRALYSQFFAYDATNFRLREIALGYTFHFRSGYIRSAKLSLVGSNLFFLYRGKALLNIPGMPDRKAPVDPNMTMGAGNAQGVESGTLPISRSLGLNLNVNF